MMTFPAIPATTSLGPVRLRVTDLERGAAFYQRVIGLREMGRGADGIRLGVGPDEVLVELVGDGSASARPARTTGLFHLALLVPTRADLAQALHRVTGAGWSFTGAADHLVSEALYLDDPEGNGIEIYRDRPRAEWPRDATSARHPRHTSARTGVWSGRAWRCTARKAGTSNATGMRTITVRLGLARQ